MHLGQGDRAHSELYPHSLDCRYTCFQGFHEGVTLEDWPKDKQWKGREAGGAFRDMVKVRAAS